MCVRCSAFLSGRMWRTTKCKFAVGEREMKIIVNYMQERRQHLSKTVRLALCPHSSHWTIEASAPDSRESRARCEPCNVEPALVVLEAAFAIHWSKKSQTRNGKRNPSESSFGAWQAPLTSHNPSDFQDLKTV